MAFSFRYPNKSCSGGNYCCETCIYFCWSNGACAKAFNTLKLCSSDGLTYSGSDPTNGISATATYSFASGWSVSYTCTGGSGSHSWGAGSSLPLTYEDPGAGGYYFSLSSTSTACGGGGVTTDCFNCIAVSPPPTRTVFCTLSGWTVCGLNFDGTYSLTGPDASNCWSYVSSASTVNQNACGNTCQNGTNCFVQLHLSLCCGPTGVELSAFVPSGAGNCAVSGSFSGGIWFCNYNTPLKSASATIPYVAFGASNWGACNFSESAGSGATFHY